VESSQNAAKTIKFILKQGKEKVGGAVGEWFTPDLSQIAGISR
jgi:hypothetical protein